MLCKLYVSILQHRLRFALCARSLSRKEIFRYSTFRVPCIHDFVDFRGRCPGTNHSLNEDGKFTRSGFTWTTLAPQHCFYVTRSHSRRRPAPGEGLASAELDKCIFCHVHFVVISQIPNGVLGSHPRGCNPLQKMAGALLHWNK